MESNDTTYTIFCLYGFVLKSVNSNNCIYPFVILTYVMMNEWEYGYCAFHFWMNTPFWYVKWMLYILEHACRKCWKTSTNKCDDKLNSSCFLCLLVTIERFRSFDETSSRGKIWFSHQSSVENTFPFIIYFF